MVRPIIRIGMIVAFAFSLTGCILPIPSRTVTREGLTGKIVDESTYRPIPRAKITVEFALAPHYEKTESQQTLTSSKGEFSIRPKYLQHWVKIVGPLTHEWPHPDHFGRDVPAAIKIEHPNYESVFHSFSSKAKQGTESTHLPTPPVPETNRIYELKPRSPQ